MAEEAYYLDGSRNQQGPVPIAEIGRLIRAGAIRRDTLVWYAGMPEWRPAGQVNEFAAMFAPAAPARPPSAAAPPQAARPMGHASRLSAAASDRLAPQRMDITAPEGAPTDTLVAQIGVWGLFWRSIVSLLGTLFIIPAPWTGTMFYRYLVENVWLPSGRRLTFAGGPGDIWYVFIGFPLVALLGLIPFAFLLTIPLNCLLEFLLFRWVCDKVGTEDGSVKLGFNGGFWGFLGWNLLLGLSGLTIIGWAWVLQYFFRWLCRNVSGSVSFEFVGTGWGILWRGVVFVLAAMFVIPIPWLGRWMWVWLLSQVRAADLATHFD